MSGVRQTEDIAVFEGAWDSSWPGCPPVANLVRRRYAERWVRFHSLPGAKRYATSPAEHAEILRRHRALLAALLDDRPAADRTLKAITCAWSATPSPTPRDTAVTAAVPEAVHWRSDDLATEPGFHSWQHHYVSRTHLDDPALDQLLLCVADDVTDGVILTDATCAWIFHPYDGGADVFAGSVEARDRLAAAYADWLPPTPSGK
ncbi:DUF3885 domain-containing protein [Streptomyces goshikiensis]|uniref:DUF3885 domain-containing protein n=1 Tax=Streptomyces goshikiensis TaxID=1942 RepID=UPI003711FC28